MALVFNKRPALVAYVTCGDPDLATTQEVVLAAIGAGVAVVELGVPFSDPVADGPVIQRASERALSPTAPKPGAAGAAARKPTTLADVLEVARAVRRESDAGLIIFSYLNPVLRFGLERFCAAAEDAGADGALITDLTVEEADEYVRLMRARNLATVFLAAPTSTDERLRRIARASRGFVYAVSRTGVTGTRKELATDARELVRRLKKFTKLPIAVGFGISTAEQFAEASEFADAVVVGSAIVEVVEQAGREGAAKAVAEFVESLRKKQLAGAKS